MTEEELQKILSKKGYSIVSESKPEERGDIKHILKRGAGLGDGLKGWAASPPLRHAGKGADVERSAGPEPVREEKTTLNYSGQCTLRVKAFRHRLCDPDGNCFKYHIDFLRYIGAIKEDNDAAIRLIFEPQEKVKSKQEERCEITVEYPSVDFDNMWTKTPIN